MTFPKKGALLAGGKTKRIWETIPEDGGLVIVENKDAITAFDNPKFTKRFDLKAKYATETTCCVFKILKKAGVPSAYLQQVSASEFLAPKCEMIPLEAVARRYAAGSFAKRNPGLERSAGEAPFRFSPLVIEFFLKTTKGKLTAKNGKIIIDGLIPEQGEEDPLILNPSDELWKLAHSKKPLCERGAKFNKKVAAPDVIGPTLSMEDLEDYLRDTFLALEGVWLTLGYRLIDLKIEFGLTHEGELLVADVIDNDSWRLQNPHWVEFSKEAFRQGEKLGQVEEKYKLVADLITGFRIPRQCLVLWRDSEQCTFPKIPQSIDLESIFVKTITASDPNLEYLHKKFPDGIVVIAKTRETHALRMNMSETPWPVILIQEDAEFKNLEAEANAISLAICLLSQKNPFLYMQMQRKDEEMWL